MSPDWHSFVNAEGPRLFKYFLARFDTQTADDLVQEVLIRVVRKVRSGSFDPNRGNLTALSFGIAHNIAREAFRDKKRSLEYPTNEGFHDDQISSEIPRIDEALSHEQELKRLRTAMTKLSNSEQEVLSLLVSQDLPLPEIGTALNLPVNTVKSHIHRAKEKLRNELTTSVSIRNQVNEKQ
jgi:RNA polymerase sigma-70 factor (ECF subfamily)